MRPDMTIESFGDLKVTEAEIETLADAHDELSARLMPDATAAVAEAADDDPAAPGNIVGVGVGDKTTNGVPTGRVALTVLVRKKVELDEMAAATRVPEIVGGVEKTAWQVRDFRSPDAQSLHRHWVLRGRVPGYRKRRLPGYG